MIRFDVYRATADNIMSVFQAQIDANVQEGIATDDMILFYLVKKSLHSMRCDIAKITLSKLVETLVGEWCYIHPTTSLISFCHIIELKDDATHPARGYYKIHEHLTI